MHNEHTPLPVTRRDFLRASGGALGFLAFSGFAPSLLAQSALKQLPKAEKDRTILVLVQLAGGNDGLNTIVPFADDNYYRLRPSIGLKQDQLVDLSDTLGFHPSLDPMARLFYEGQLSVVQNVGYPNPNRSHFRSSEIWETATDSDVNGYTGWVGRYFDNACAGTPTDDPLGVHLGDQVPQMFAANDPHNVFGLQARGRVAQQEKEDVMLLESLTTASTKDENASYLQHTMMDALVTERRVQALINDYRTPVNYSGDGLSQSLKRVAALIAGGMETRVYFVSQGGYDTHSNQLGNHANRLRELANAMSTFQQDLKKKGLDGQVLTMTFSEFGRRPSENASQGTDHGTAAPLFVMGTGVRETLVGTPASLDLKKNQDLEFSTDFRQVYATVIDKWLQADSTQILGQQFETMEFI